MSEYFTLAEIDYLAGIVRSRMHYIPKTGIILGSGLGEFASSIENPVVIPYRDLPSWPVSTVEGHQGRLVMGLLEGKEVLVMQGRAHYYEGYSMAQVGLPVRVMQRLGLQNLFVTNAAGAVNPDFQPGDLMLITDHLNILGMAGLSPLRGQNYAEIGPRFPDMSQAYDRELIAQARQVALAENILLREGVYVCLAGPSFETPADLRYLRSIGADAVGMSTVPEVTVARHGGMRVIGISGISNKANLDGNTDLHLQVETTHEEVLAAGEMIVPKLIRMIRGVLRRIL